jgi:hypothetical protein
MPSDPTRPVGATRLRACQSLRRQVSRLRCTGRAHRSARNPAGASLT